jgi:CheY-like chemotaxis protein
MIQPEILNLNDAIDTILAMLKRLIGEHITLNWQPLPELWMIKMDPSQVYQLLINLCLNARDAIQDCGTLTVETFNCTCSAACEKEQGLDFFCESHSAIKPGEYVQLTISDTGCGMDEETKEHLFEPFFTTKEVGKGAGLGLSTVYGIVKQNNGAFNVQSELGEGTQFTIYLPRHTDTAPKVSIKEEEIPTPSGKESILIVEDEPVILDMLSLMLNKQGYTVLEAETPSKGIQISKDHQGNIDLLITDVIMPEMNGQEMASILQAENPRLKCLFMSGYTADIIYKKGINTNNVPFISKPFSQKQMALAIRNVLNEE